MNKRVIFAGISAIALMLGAAGPAWAQSGATAEVNPSAGAVIDNDSLDPGQIRPNDVTDSFNSASGIAQVQQNEGSANAINIATAVQVTVSSAGAVTASALVNADVSGNTTGQTDGARTTLITGSFLSFSGVATVQQNNGDHNEIDTANAIQANIDGSGASSSTATVELDVFSNTASQIRGTRDNDITTSFNGASGVATVQQNNGDQNAIGAANAIQAGITNDGSVTSAASVLGTTSENASGQTDGTRSNDITNSFSQFSGVATVQQNNGDHNTIGAATSLHANLGGSGDITQTASTDGSTTNPNGSVTDTDSVRSNIIDPSFLGASGIFTVQQNNGNANAIGASTAVAANVGGIDGDDDVMQTVTVMGAVPTGATVIDMGSERNNDLVNSSFNGSRGIVTVQQNNGDVNALGVATAVSANIGLTQSQVQNDVDQTVTVMGEISNANSSDDDVFDSFTTFTGQRRNNIDGSFNAGARGMASVQQNNGSQNIMGIGNAVYANIDNVAAGIDGSDDVTGQTASSSGGTVTNTAAEFGTPIVTDTPFPAHRENWLTDSFMGYAGIASVQQNNGDNNVMGVANAVAMTLRSNDKLDTVVSSVASTDGATTDNTATDGTSFFNSGANRVNTIDSSFGTFDGLATVQQNNGSNNVISASNTVVANVENTTSPVPDPAAGSVTNTAEGMALVTLNDSTDHEFSDRVNRITDSFGNAAGIMTVQQNNGENNVMGASNAVAAEINNTTLGFGPATSTATLSATVSGNMTTVSVPTQTPGLENTISASFNSASGIMVVQQNNGSNNAIQSAISVTASLSGFNGGSFLSALQ